jgi:hypothetical protein
MEHDAALHLLATTYFATRGPATEGDFAWWSGLRKEDVKGAIHSAESTLESTTIGSRKYWFHPPAVTAKPKGSVTRLLPNYDEFFIGLKDRTAMHARHGQSGINKAFNALSGHLVTIDGQIVGGWIRTFKGKKVVVTARLLARLGVADQSAIEIQAGKFGEFLETPVEFAAIAPTR